MPGATPWGSVFQINASAAGTQISQRLAFLPDGRFVAVYSDSVAPGDPEMGGVTGRIFNADGTPATGEFLVNTATIGAQSEPAVTVLEDGRFVVTWRDGTEIRGQMFTEQGARIGSDFQINTTTTGTQNAPSIAALADGGFVVVWQDAGQTGGDVSGAAIRGQVYDAAGAAAGAEFLINSTTAGNQVRPAIAGFANGGFVAAWSIAARQPCARRFTTPQAQSWGAS